MCRVLIYRGEPVLLDELLYQPNNSLVKQVYDAQMLNMLNLAGFGMLGWDPHSHNPERPFCYRSAHLPIFDRNLKDLAEKLRVSTLIGHVRGVPYHERVTVGEQNLHPFQYPNTPVVLAHNGHLADFEKMRFALLEHIRPTIAQQIRGNTDSEWIYALLLSQLEVHETRPLASDLTRAMVATLRILGNVREQHSIGTSSPANLFVTDGETVVVARYTFDYGRYDTSDLSAIAQSDHSYLSLWYTTGTVYGLHDGEWKMINIQGKEASSILVSSEPLTHDASTWCEVPEYSMLVATREAGTYRHSLQGIAF